MEVNRRDFVKCRAVASALLLPSISITSIVKGENAYQASAAVPDLDTEKSIKAYFGGGFSVRGHIIQSGGLIYADIEHFGNRYRVASAILLVWKIVESSLGNRGFASPSFTRTLPIFRVSERQISMAEVPFQYRNQ